MTKPYIVIVDIDGTLADCTHRRHHVESKPKNWAAFNETMHLDTPILPLVQMLQQLHITNQYIRMNAVRHGCIQLFDLKILIVSGREAIYRSVTEKWLDEHAIPYHGLFMRPEKDYRDDQIIKQEILNEIIQQHGRPDMVFEDRKRVVDMWRANGILCCQVAEGNF